MPGTLIRGGWGWGVAEGALSVSGCLSRLENSTYAVSHEFRPQIICDIVSNTFFFSFSFLVTPQWHMELPGQGSDPAAAVATSDP